MCLIANWKVKNKTNIFKADRVRIWLFRSTSSSLPLKPQGHEREKKGGRRRGGKKRDSFPETALKSSQLRKWLDGQRSVARKALTWQKPLNKKKGFAVCVCAGSRDAIGSQTKGDKSSNKFFLLSLFENCFFFFWISFSRRNPTSNVQVFVAIAKFRFVIYQCLSTNLTSQRQTERKGKEEEAAQTKLLGGLFQETDAIPDPLNLSTFQSLVLSFPSDNFFPSLACCLCHDGI